MMDSCGFTPVHLESGFLSRVEGSMSRVEGTMSRVEGTMSRVFKNEIK